MDDAILTFLSEEGIDSQLIEGVKAFRKKHNADEELQTRTPSTELFYYGKDVWKKALAALLAGENLLLAGPKATGKNVLAENLCAVFARPLWNVSFHINADAAYLIGTDTFNGEKVVFRPGPVYLCAVNGGFGVLDEINMAKNEALAVLHSTLDFRHVIDVPGYDKIVVRPETRFIGTMNYGYAGTRELNEALTSRFAVLDMPLISDEDLTKLLKRRFPSMRDQICGQFVRLFYELANKAQNSEISDRALDLRGLLDAIGLIDKGLTSGDALDMCITNKTFDAYERSLIHDVISARVPDSLTTGDVFAQ